MKARKSLKRFMEPLVYLLLVASFGFITTMVNHRENESKAEGSEMASFTMEHEIESIYYQEDSEVNL